jgi:hypothetical protein
VAIKLLGLGFIVLFIFLILIFAFLDRKDARFLLREIPAYQRLKREISLAVEGGKKLHLTLGRGGITDIRAGSGFIGLSMLHRISRTVAVSDHPPVVSSGEALISILARDTIKNAFTSAGAEQFFDPNQSRLSGLTPFAYAAGAMPVVLEDKISVDVLAGSFGAEVGLIIDAAEQSQGVVLGGSDNLSAQAVMYASVQDPLIGEELYASGAYLQSGPWQRTSIRVQDLMRWVLVGALLAGAVLKIAGVL